MTAAPAQSSADPRRRGFFALNAAAALLVLAAAALVWIRRREPLQTTDLVALVLLVLGIGLAATSYLFYRSFMRDELVERAARRSKRRN